MPYELEKVHGLFYVKNQNTGERKNKKPMPRKRALAYMRALYAAEDTATKKEAGSFTVQKQADGSYRWILFSSNAYQDRDMEIVSTKALEADVDLTDKLKEYGPLRWWHVGGYECQDAADYTTYKADKGLDIGDCDFRMVNGKVLIESGTFHDAKIAEALAPVAKELQASIRFSHPHEEPDAEGVFTHTKTFERSILPKGRASNRFTQLLVTEVDSMATVKEKVQAFAALLKDESLVETILKQAETIQKEAEEAGVASKDKLTLKVGDVEHPMGDFLVHEDPEKVTTWHLPVKNNGEPDTKLMGAAKAALTSPGGHRGKKYAGPGKEDAISALKKMYEAQKMDWESKEEKEEFLAPDDWFDVSFVDANPVVEMPKETTTQKQLSFDDRRMAVQDELNDKFVDADGVKVGPWIVDIFDDFVVCNGGEGLFKLDYSIDDSGDVEFSGDPVPVTRHTLYVPEVAEPAQQPSLEPIITGLKELKDLLAASVTQKDAQIGVVNEAVQAQAKKIQELEQQLTQAKEHLAELEGGQPRSVKQLQQLRATEKEGNIVPEPDAAKKAPGPDKTFMEYVFTGGLQPGQ